MAKGDKIFMSTVDIVKSFVSDPEVMNLFDRDKLRKSQRKFVAENMEFLKAKTLD